jgi:hypothetical protein
MNISFSANFFLAAVLASALLTSCKKDNSVGLDFIDDQLGVLYDDSKTITTHTVPDDSLSTSLRSSTLLGTLDDPYFGKTTASVYSQFLLSSVSPIFPSGSVCDSVVISLVYKGFYGTLEPQRFMVHQLTSDLYKDTVYYSIDSALYNPAPLGDQVITPNPFDSLFISGDSVAPQLRIRLSNSFGNSILNASANDLATNDNFKQFFKGLHITSVSTGRNGRSSGNILYFNWAHPQTKITLYYRNSFGTHGNQGASSYSLIINSGAVSFNNFSHDYSSNPEIVSQLSTNDTIQSLRTYIQSLSGLKTKIYFPNLQSLTANGPIAVNKAELIIKADPSTIDNDLQPPTRLALVYLDSLGNQLLLTDFVEGDAYFGGTWDAVKKEYRFNLARHVQRLLTGDIKDYGLVLLATGSAVNGNRVVIGGGSSMSQNKMKLKITYTKLN